MNLAHRAMTFDLLAMGAVSMVTRGREPVSLVQRTALTATDPLPGGAPPASPACVVQHTTRRGLPRNAAGLGVCQRTPLPTAGGLLVLTLHWCVCECVRVQV